MFCLCTFNISCAVHEVDNEGKSSLSSFLVKSLLLLFLPLYYKFNTLITPNKHVTTNSFKTTSYLVTTIILVFRFKTASCLITTLHNIPNTRHFHANIFRTLYLTSIFHMIHIHAFKTLSLLLSFFYMQPFLLLQFPFHLHPSHISPKHEIDSQNLLFTFFFSALHLQITFFPFFKTQVSKFFLLYFYFPFLHFLLFTYAHFLHIPSFISFINHFLCTIFLCF